MSSSKYLFIRFLILYIYLTGVEIKLTTALSDNIDIVLLVESLSVEHPLVLLGVGIIEDPGVVVIAVFILSPDSAHGHSVAVVPEHRVIIIFIFRIMKIYKHQKCSKIER